MPRMLLVVALLLSSWAATTFARPIAFESKTTPESTANTKFSSSSVYIVQLKDAPLATYDGNVVGLNATSPQSKGTRKLDVESQDSINYRQYLQSEQNTVLATAQQVVGEPLDVVHSYDVAFNGFAVHLTEEQAAQIAELPGVLSVQQEEIYSLQTDVGPSFIGAAQDDFEAALYKADLSGDNEVPPNDSTATGTGVFTYDAETSTLTFNIATTGVEVGGPGAHIHLGAADENGPVEIDLIPFEVSPGVFIGSAELDDDQETALYASELYVNIHSEEFTGGEIRGQIDPNKGEGMIAGIIDSGINYDHESFADVGADGYDHTNPLGEGTYVGVCDPESDIFQESFVCNDKLIGAWTWPDTADDPDPLGNPSPADENGHGTHVASTVAGNEVESSINGIDTGTLAGVAPHANIIAYDGCGVGGCPGSALVASIDQATADGVDVINYSIGGGSNSPWLNPTAVAFRNAFAAGVFSATSVGNSGPNRETIGSPANAPWIMAVGFSTHDRLYENGVTNLSGGTTTPPEDIFGKGFSGPLGENTIVYAGAEPYNNALCGPFADETDLSGLIVVCDRGTFGRVAKAANVDDAGGAGYVLANDEDSGTSLNGDIYPIPGVHITFEDGVTLKEWLASGADHTAEIRGAEKEVSDDFGDIVATGSSRGPDATLPDILKPDVTAPGVDILAAVVNTDAEESEYGFLSGSSMSSPHAAGAAVLMRQMHPDWSPTEVQSALMTTAVTEGVSTDSDGTSASPFDIGAGRIDVSKAVQAGLIMNETAANHEAANPAEDGVPAELNLPSMADSACVVDCTWSRTFTSALATEASWTITTTATEGLDITVEPSSFTIPAGGEQTISITANVEGLPLNEYVFGALVLMEENELAPTARLPIAAQPTGSTLTDLIQINANGASGSETIADVNAIAVEELTTSIAGLVKGEQSDLSLATDSDNSDVYDDLTDGAEVLSYEVPENTARFITEVIASTAPDIDMFVHIDGIDESEPDGIPQEDEQVCVSATGTALETCDLATPPAGTYLVIIQNWEGSEAAQDDITVSTGVVPSEDANNLTVTGPTDAIPSKTPFDLQLSWQLADSELGSRWYGVFEVGTSAESTDNLGTVRVNIFNEATSYLNFLPIVAR
ncbi:MAG: S8 family serine peptidase [Chloroflexota bacterium]